MTWLSQAPLIEQITFLITLFGAGFAFLAYLTHVARWHWKKQRLIRYLQAEKARKTDKGQRSVLNITRELGLTQDEILQMSYWCKNIRRTVRTDSNDFADKLLFEYIDPKGN
jgi:hypothetical protein